MSNRNINLIYILESNSPCGVAKVTQFWKATFSQSMPFSLFGTTWLVIWSTCEYFGGREATLKMTCVVGRRSNWLKTQLYASEYYKVSAIDILNGTNACNRRAGAHFFPNILISAVTLVTAELLVFTWQWWLVITLAYIRQTLFDILHIDINWDKEHTL